MFKAFDFSKFLSGRVIRVHRMMWEHLSGCSHMEKALGVIFKKRPFDLKNGIFLIATEIGYYSYFIKHPYFLFCTIYPFFLPIFKIKILVFFLIICVSSLQKHWILFLTMVAFFLFISVFFDMYVLHVYVVLHLNVVSTRIFLCK